MFCHYCGAELHDYARFCSKCGETIADPPVNEQVPTPPVSALKATTRPGIRNPLIGVGLIVACLALVSGVVIGCRVLNKPKLGDTRVNPIDKAKMVRVPGDTRVNSIDKAKIVRVPGDTCFNPIDNAKMVWVPGGNFTMGTPEGVGEDNEHPAHQVTLTGFWLYKYEVTVAQYRTFCTATERALPKFPDTFSWEGKRGWDDPALQQHPIVNVSWYDAQAYAVWAKVALPTEAQWEYAARGSEGRNYPWGGTATANNYKDGWDATKCANIMNSFFNDISTWPVGSFLAGASWCGAQDLAGNVFEWCTDWYGDYSATRMTNPDGAATGEYRVVRGGSWYLSIIYGNRSAYRVRGNPYGWFDSIGFRCVTLSP